MREHFASQDKTKNENNNEKMHANCVYAVLEIDEQ